MEDILVPIFCGCILPVAIVLIISLRKRNSDNKRAEVMMKALEFGEEVKAEKLAKALGRPIQSPLQILNARLLRGCLYFLVGMAILLVDLLMPGLDREAQITLVLFGAIGLAIGLAYLIVYFVTRNQVSDNNKS